MAKRRKKNQNEKILKPLRPSVGLEVEYRRKLYALIDEMVASTERWTMAAYRREKPAIIALDAEPPPIIDATFVGGTRPWIATISGDPLVTSNNATIRFATRDNAIAAARRAVGEILPADQIQAALSGLSEYWLSRFDAASKNLADFFSKSAYRRTDDRLKKILRDGGMTVKFEPTPAQLDILRASVHENVALIKSIPEQYLKNVEGMVMRSVQTGRDLGSLSKDLQEQYGVTKRRAALIARDQNNKATSVFQEARRKEIGITEAIWMHSHAGKKPRPTHVRMDGKRYKIAEGMYDSAVGRNVWPGSEINCRCVSRAVIPALDRKS